MLAAVNWTVLGVLLTALFTGAVALFAILGYRLGLNEARSAKRTLYKFALVDLVQVWAGVPDRPDACRLQLRIGFENKHPSDPLRYEIESSSVRAAELSELPAIKGVGDDFNGGSGGGVVPPGQREFFTLMPLPSLEAEPFLIADVPTHVVIQFTIRYGAARHHRDFEWEWREKRLLAAVLNQTPQPGPVSVPFTVMHEGNAPAVDRLSKRSLWERVVRKQ